ncbi:helix-turn-helix transcriptional regulator [Streptomyces sp. NBC_00160]|uniref:helix-turn-helix domain-containing protein n=1 Tax=Streptomyces TaxID=1883 RepID=UPI00224F2FF4|nr:helix-turn-helix transcriptional regulator [Streptomyces sp. NBC_00160]MCX5308987.1 helix-turn-helix transcriptional regulator [Streptomyces sp. NBC_00160]
MVRKLDYRWHLREVMAMQGMFSTTDLKAPLAERGIVLSPSQTYRLVTERPERLNLAVLMALMDILGCRMEDLIEPVAAQATAGRRAAGQSQDDREGGGGVGEFRPRRARILPPAEGGTGAPDGAR